MTTNEVAPMFAATPPRDVILDPRDPKTWWIVSANQEHNWIQATAQLHDHSMTVAGVPATKFYYDATTYVNTGAAVAAYYGLDSPARTADAYNYEAEAMGQPMIYGEDSMPTIDFRRPLIKEPQDLLKLKVPDWLSFPRVRYALESTRLVASMGRRVGAFCAPFSLAVGLRTYPMLIRDLRRNPQFAQDLFTFLVDEILPSYLRVQKEYCGITSSAGADAWAAFPNLTPEMTEQWVVPYAMRLLHNCLPFGMKATTLGGGYCEERLEKFDKDILFRCFDVHSKLVGGQPSLLLGMGRWHEYPLEPVVEYLTRYTKKGIRPTVTAGVNARLLRDGPVDRIVATVKRFIDVLGREHDLTIFLANIPADTPPEHVHAAVAATHIYGHLPIAKNLDEVEFEVPQRESFQEYVARMSGGVGLNV